jgi:hypothetical protein
MYSVSRIELDGVERDSAAPVASLRAALEERDRQIAADKRGPSRVHYRVTDDEDPERGELDWDAEELQCLGHPAEDCGPEGEHCAIGDVLYCDGRCRG